MSGHIRVRGLPELADDRPGDPTIIRWVSVAPDGAVEVHVADNRIAYSAERNRWIQWRLIEHVFRVIDAKGYCARHHGLVATVIHTDDDGVVWEPHRHRSVRPANPVASAMLAAVGVTRSVHGTVAWLGEKDPDTGFYRELDDLRLDALHVLGGQCRARVMTRAVLGAPQSRRAAGSST